ncbi:MAG: putative N-acetyltransferase YsnE [Pseudomonadota bacterium]
MKITPGNLDDPRIIALLEQHLETMRSASPPKSVHALDLTGLKQPEISFWAIWDGDTLCCVAALKTLSADHGEIKSMHTAALARRRGAGQAS